MARRKDPEIEQYTLKNGKKYFRLKTYIGTDPETGKSIKVTRSKLKSRKEAELVRNKLKADGVQKFSKESKMNFKKTVNDVFQAWLSVKELDVRGSTISIFKGKWKNQIKPEFGTNYINAISPDHLQSFVDDMASKYVTYQSIINLLHRVLKYAIFRHWADHDPFDFVIIPKKSQVQSRDNSKNFYELSELKQFIKVAKRYSLMKYTCFLTIASLGCRRGEALALKWSDIDFKNHRVKIERTVAKDENNIKTIDDVKNSVHHTVPMSHNLYAALKEYKQHLINIGDNCQWIFHQRDGSFCWSQQIDEWIKYLYVFDQKEVDKWNHEHPNEKRSYLRQITPHGLRHTLATLLYDGNPNIKPKDIQYILGHKTPKTALEIYTHVTKKQKKDIRSSINNLDF